MAKANEKTETVKQQVMAVSKIAAKSMGNPKVAAGFSDEDATAGRIHWLGVMFGRASGLKRTITDKNGKIEEQIGLTGIFECHPEDKRRPIQRSGVCYLPPGVRQMVEAEVAALGDDKTGVIFAYRVGTIRSTNAVGYEYVSHNMVEITGEDALSGIREAVAQQDIKLLTN